jgi:diadenosine tetraphosphate (Ap4A) HIT family hydrolase
MTGCPFCERIATSESIAENAHAVAFWDAYPVNPGHALVVPRRHEPDYFALTPAEQDALWRLAAVVRGMIDARHLPDGYNLGVNAGPAAGQTVSHAHLHVIPRYRGDVADPRGGVRWVLPDRARYWDD